MSKIKIFISYKNKNKLLKSDILQPIQTGRAIADESFEGMLGDDIGDNISKENPKYCELTAQYWVWKNQDKIDNPEYIGFMHYRRHFLFNQNLDLPIAKWFDTSNFYIFPLLSEKYLEYIKDEEIEKYFPEHDCIIPKPYDVKNINPKFKVMKDNFLTLKEQEGYFYDIFIEVLKEKFSSYNKYIEQFANNTTMYMCNMFVAKKEIFDEYSEFLFTVLKEVDKRIDSTKFSNAKLRFLGYLGEYCLSIYILKLKNENKVKIKELDCSLIMPINKKVTRRYKKRKFLRHFVFGKLKQKYNLRCLGFENQIEFEKKLRG